MELVMPTTTEQDTWLFHTHVPLRSIGFQPSDYDCGSKCISQKLTRKTAILTASTHTLEVTLPLNTPSSAH